MADWHRGQRAAAPLLPEDPAANAPADDPDLLRALPQSAEVLPPSLLWHRILDDWSIDDLARWAGIPAGTVKSRLSHQTQALRRRLYDWREGPPYRRPRVREFAERRLPPDLFVRLNDLSRPRDYFQHLRVGVGSRLDLTLDCLASNRVREPWLVYCQDASLPFAGAIWNRRGTAITSRVHREEGQGWPRWAYWLNSPDDQELLMRSQCAPSHPMAQRTIDRSRQGFAVTLDVRVDPFVDDVLTLTLPPNIDVVRVSPTPAARAADHGRPVLTWTGTATLAACPRVECRWR